MATRWVLCIQAKHAVHLLPAISDSARCPQVPVEQGKLFHCLVCSMAILNQAVVSVTCTAMTHDACAVLTVLSCYNMCFVSCRSRSECYGNGKNSWPVLLCLLTREGTQMLRLVVGTWVDCDQVIPCYHNRTLFLCYRRMLGKPVTGSNPLLTGRNSLLTKGIYFFRLACNPTILVFCHVG